MNSVSFICIDSKCYRFAQQHNVESRSNFLDHVKKKQPQRILEALEPLGVISDFSYLTRWSLINIFADCCYARNARKLLGNIRHD